MNLRKDLTTLKMYVISFLGMISRTYDFSTETKLNKIFSGSHNFEAAERLKQELKRAEAPPTLVQFFSLLNQIF